MSDGKKNQDNVIKFQKPKRSRGSQTIGAKPKRAGASKQSKPQQGWRQYSFSQYFQLFLVIAIAAYLLQTCRG